MRFQLVASLLICIFVLQSEQKIFDCEFISHFNCEHYKSCKVSNDILDPRDGKVEFYGTQEQKLNVENLWFENTKLDYIPSDVFYDFPSLKGIVITNNIRNDSPYPNITKIRSTVFRELQPIKSLVYRDEFIKSIEDGAFENLKNLESVEFTMTDLTSFPSSLLRNSRYLKSIYLQFKDFGNFNQYWFMSFPNLESITIFSSKVVDIPKELFSRNRNLKYINLNANELKDIKPEIFNTLPELEHVELAFNNLKYIPANLFANNRKLYTVNLQFNEITALDENLFAGLTRLSRVYLGNNWLTTLPEKIFKDNKLTDLILDSNKIEVLPLRIFENQDMLEIVLMKNLSCFNEDYRGVKLYNIQRDIEHCFESCRSSYDCYNRNVLTFGYY
jgi:Leucine-rich repeat (LRR) protein